MNTASTTLSEALLARASALHDAAFADPKVGVKPSFAQSIDAARADADYRKKAAADAAEAEAADALARATQQKATADAAEQEAAESH